MTRRADVILVEAGLFESRSKAAAAIQAGLVSADGRPVPKASTQVSPAAVLDARPAHPWVSRGGTKLAAGLAAFGIDPAGRVCLDVGASTGGFTQVLLARGAAHLTAVDVGHGQFHASLRGDPRVTLLEGQDARSLDETMLPRAFDLLTCDVSFISLKLVLSHVFTLAALRSEVIVLVKPQFEAGPKNARKGIVRDPAIHEAVCRDVAALVERLGWQVLGIEPSPIAGGDGNREFLLGARRGHA
ncbi:MAG TPA: TlyA family RNA methyltransferase [Lichenihabitans sp.]|nr:TlyA family RNA methyltransferase [Lichenihabitans sp.]